MHLTVLDILVFGSLVGVVAGITIALLVVLLEAWNSLQNRRMDKHRNAAIVRAYDAAIVRASEADQTGQSTSKRADY